jgi:hypothetical protein
MWVVNPEILLHRHFEGITEQQEIPNIQVVSVIVTYDFINDALVCVEVEGEMGVAPSQK